MQTIYDPSLQAHLTVDEGDRVRHIRYSPDHVLSEETIPRLSAAGHLAEIAETLQIPADRLQGVHKRAQHLWPVQQGIEYQLDEEKQLFDSTTIGYCQTYLNVPVWRRGISVTVKHAPTRIVSVTDNSEEDLEGSLPSENAIDRYRKIFQTAELHRRSRAVGLEEGDTDETTTFMRRTLRRSGRRARPDDHTRILNGAFFVYKYEPSLRFAGQPSPPERTAVEDGSLEESPAPFIPLPDVADEIEPGRAYLVAELIFRHDLPGFGHLVWLALVEVETGSILYIECMTCGVNALVFKRDPMVSSGDLTVTSDDSNAVLENHDFDELLNALDAPTAGTQHLRGTYVVVQDIEAPSLAPPTQPTGSDFDYQPRTNEFAAANAYYHQTELFRTIESLGFPIASYFNGTTFPVEVDHRGLGNVINAHWSPNGTGGTDHMCYALCDTTNVAQPLGRAVDPWVHWHEMGGHGSLGDHVGSGTFLFAHSAGDGLAALQNDPESALRALPERFRYAPFRPFTTERRFDRPVPAWAWGSANDDGNPSLYGSEQILATCHFRAYRSIGGDHDDVGRRRFASRVMTYLILRSIGELTQLTNPSNWDPATSTTVPGRGAQLWCERMQATDLENWTSEGLSGGAYNKVIRWAFEEQGSYGGNPPPVDVYIDDGRGGEYPFQAMHWHNTSMWNRNSPDGVVAHQNAVIGATNYMYVKVKNRGTSAAGTVTVKGWHCLPGAGLTWPVDFTAMSPAAGLSVASIGANNTQEVTLGPFEWVPNSNIYGHDCVLMIASTAGDASNVAHFTGTETIEEWRLVPNDNNIGQRNVTLVAGAGPEALLSSLDGAIFVAGNSFNRPARMELRVELPNALAARGWALDAGDGGSRFRLGPGEKRTLRLRLIAGDDFTAADVAADPKQEIKVELHANGVLLGGMSYHVDPNLKEPSGGPRSGGGACIDAAKDLLDCLHVAGGDNVKGVRVKKVSLDIDFGCDRDC